MLDVSLWLMLANVLRWLLCLRNLESVQIVTIKKESLLKDWFVHRGRPRLIRMDPDVCHMSNEMLEHVA